MKRLLRLGALASLVVVATAYPARGATETLVCDHVQLAVPDPAQAVEWYVKHLGGTPTERGDGVLFGAMRLSFSRAAGGRPSEGSVIDRIGFSFANVEAKMAELQAAGVKVLAPPRQMPQLFTVASVQDPWGTTIEIVQDPRMLGFHHIHVTATDALASTKWLLTTIGGDPGRVAGQIDALQFRGLWVITEQADHAPAPAAGSVINHVGWRVADVDGTVAALKAGGVKVTIEPRVINGLRVAFIEGPDGLRFELVQPQ